MDMMYGFVCENQDLRDWDDAGASFSPSGPVSSTGTGLSPLPSREMGILSVGFSWCPPPFTSGLTSL